MIPAEQKGHECYLDSFTPKDELCTRDSCYGCSYWQSQMWTREDDDDYDGDGDGF